MPTKKYKQKLMKHRICVASRVLCCAMFLVLAIIGVSSLVRAMSLESVEHQNGIPSAWKIASLGHPDSITVPITYWDQRQDDCTATNRQFEWTICQFWTAGALQGVVKNTLGRDGLPIPSYVTAEEAWAANHDVFTANVTGHDPVQSTDNFYRWFHNTSVSEQYNRQITFQRIGDSNSYTYGGQNIFPLDDITFSDSDTASQSGNSDDGKQHNFHFTAHMSIPMKISADGTELFEFSGDDDVWVFLNGHLVLDIGGLHEALNGSFRINTDGTVTSYVQNVNDVSDREQLGKPGTWAYNYVQNLNNHNRATYADKTQTIDIGLKAGDVVNLDFFYAERSTTASNTKITITNMNWPISADSDVQGKIMGKLEGSESNLIQYTTSVKNRDPLNPLTLQRLSSFISDKSSAITSEDSTEEYLNAGFLPLDIDTLYYTTTPNDESSWAAIDLTPPMNSDQGFTFKEPLTMTPSGQQGDTLYFRFYAETSEYSGDITNLTAYYTNLNGMSGVTYDNITLSYDGKTSTGDEINTDSSYNLRVSYTIDWEGAEPDPNIFIPPAVIRNDLPTGTEYSIDTPALDGFTPDRSNVSGTITDSNVNVVVTYKKVPPIIEPNEYRILIHYIKKDGTKVFPDYDKKHIAGDIVDIAPNNLDGYTKDTDTILFEVKEDIEIYVVYTPNTPVIPGITTPTNPSTPHTPTDPNTPTTPETPSTTPESPLPTIPVVSNGDNGLVFIAPLGEVAYVPNTGVINGKVAPIFEQYFAEVVLSQGFVLAALLIFAASFATYFSLRRHLTMSANTHPTSVKKMPKSVANSATARAMKSRAKKSAKATTKLSAKPSTRTTSTARPSKTSKTKVAKTTKSAKASKTSKK